ncbi:hypothetical protein KAH27_04075, partial [bacterium]|nr:hypothetical protein [bacterium]
AGATNQVLIDSKTYTDSATNAVGTTWDDRWVNQSGDSMSGSLDMANNDISNVNYLAVKDLYAENETVINIIVSNTALVTTSLTVQGVIDVTGHNITNLAPATEGHMAVNYDQLTNATSDLSSDIAGATNQVLIDANNYTVNYTDAATNSVLNTANTYTENYTDSATNTLMNDADTRFVNVAGDNMTGILGMGGNRITNVADAVNPQDAITRSQLDAATNSLGSNVDLQRAYDNGNSIVTTGTKGDVTISGTEGLHVTGASGIAVTGGADIQVLNSGDVYVDGGDVTVNGSGAVSVGSGGVSVLGGNVEVNGGGNVEVNGPSGSQINMDSATGNESIRLNGSGKMVIYSGGSLALEFE